MTENWWKEAVVYQIYPRSFKDSSGDGIGDLQGITEKLDYIRDLGANVIWLCPICKSPNDDNGYDISDYTSIMPDFGTMADFDELLSKAHEKGLRILLDMVFNHTSDEHAWFAESRRSRDNPRRDYYIWREGKDGSPPNNWGSCFGGSAWTQDSETGMYYLHLFSKKQPDLNWDNGEVRESVYGIMRWWLDRGVDGFRLDVINFISKTPGLPDGPITGDGPYGSFSPAVANGPNVHRYLHEMNERVLAGRDVMLVGETPDVTVEEAKKFAGFDTGELNMVFQFEHMDLGQGRYGKWNDSPIPLRDLKAILDKWQLELDGKAWNSLYWNNHDRPRVVSRFGCDSTPLSRKLSAKMLATCLYLMKGTPFIYQGEELGMTNVAFESLSDYRDIETLNVYRELVHLSGVPHDEMMRYIYHSGRDNARTPMQWSAGPNAGFTEGMPWIRPNPNYTEINAEESENDPDSVLHFYRRLIALRRGSDVLIHGGYEPICPEDDRVYSYIRRLGDKAVLVLCNFTGSSADYTVPTEFSGRGGRLLLSNYPEDVTVEAPTLRPFEARAYLYLSY